jgi:hypothetical protein
MKASIEQSLILILNKLTQKAMASNLRFFGNLLGATFCFSINSVGMLNGTSLQHRVAIAQQPERHQYPANFVADYMKDCHKSVIARDIPVEEADTLCKCTLNKFQSQYSVSEFQTLVRNSKKDKKTASKLTDVGNACFEQILYEQ